MGLEDIKDEFLFLEGDHLLVVDPVPSAEVAQFLEPHFSQIVDRKPRSVLPVVGLAVLLGLGLLIRPLEALLPADEACLHRVATFAILRIATSCGSRDLATVFQDFRLGGGGFAR